MHVDHPMLGGLCAPIDERGCLGQPRDRRIGHRFDRHPDTGAVLKGRPVTAYHAARALALRAHDAIDTAGIISWDVAVLDGGPVLLEGNSLGSLELIQVAHDEPLGGTEFVTIAERLQKESRLDTGTAVRHAATE
jgi:hypothetical protein